MAKNKKTRKQLLKEPDKFMTFSSRLIEELKNHKVQAAWTLGIFIIVLIVISGFLYQSNRAEYNSFVMLEQCMAKYRMAVKTDGQVNAYHNVKDDFQKIIDKYPKKTGGKLTQVVFANICYNAADFDNAIEIYNKALGSFGDSPSLRNLILSSLGYSYEGKKDYKKAAANFEMIVSGSGLIMKDEAYFNLGRLYAEMDDKVKSIEAFKKILSDYPGSIYIDLVKERIAA